MKKIAMMTILVCMVISSNLFAWQQSPDSIKISQKDSVPAGKKSTGLEVKPARIDFHLSKGEAAFQSIYITNNFSKPMQFKARLVDWMRDSLGGHQYFEPGTIPRSCAQWMSFGNDVIEIDPGKTKDILVKLAMPDNDSVVNDMHWCLVFLESVNENKVYKQSDSSRAHVNTIFRVGIHILQTPPQLESQKELEMLSFKAVPGEKDQYQILCHNSGKTQLECKSYIELSSLQSGKKITLGPNYFPLFPDQKRYIEFTLPPDLEKGKYSVLAVADAGEDDIPLQASEAIIDIK